MGIISLHSIELGHNEFLLRLFKENRLDLTYISGLSEQQKTEFIFKQFTMEQEQLIQIYPGAEFNIVMLNEEPVGQLYIQHGKATDRILEIGLLEEYRGLGIGRKILTSVIEDAIKKSKCICLQVAWFNHAAYLFYKKMGFQVIEDKGVFYEMQYTH